MNNQVLIVCGLTGSGKSTLSDHLSTFGWATISAGKMIRDLYGQLNPEMLSPTIEDFQQFGMNFQKENGDIYFAQKLIERAASIEKVILDGIRSLQCVSYIRNTLSNSFVVYVEAPSMIRERRLCQRENMDGLRFKNINANIMETQTIHIKDISDFIIHNNSSLDDFIVAITAVISVIESRS